VVVEIVFENEVTLMGVIVDSIQEVINIPEEKISEVPYINAKVKSEYIKGIAEAGDTIKIILDITSVLTQEEFVMIRDLEKSKIKVDDVKEKVKKNVPVSPEADGPAKQKE
jgi:purine-binding chemotaxis protein CheW